MGLASKWIMPDDRGVVYNRCDARSVELSDLLRAELSQSAKRDISCKVLAPKNLSLSLKFISRLREILETEGPQVMGRGRRPLAG